MDGWCNTQRMFNWNWYRQKRKSFYIVLVWFKQFTKLLRANKRTVDAITRILKMNLDFCERFWIISNDSANCQHCINSAQFKASAKNPIISNAFIEKNMRFAENVTYNFFWINNIEYDIIVYTNPPLLTYQIEIYWTSECSPHQIQRID